MAIDLRDYSRTAAQRGWGAGWPSCNGAKAAGTAVVTADRSGVRISVHKRVARLVDLLMDDTERRGYLLINGQCGGYNCRAISGTSTASNHSWGLAVDLNWQSNPFARPRVTDMPGWLPLLWNRYGFAWGGNYGNNGTTGRADAMHLEFMGSPADADEMTALAIRELTGTTVQEDDMDQAQDSRLRRVEMAVEELVRQMCGEGATIERPFPGDAAGGGWTTERYGVETQKRLTLIMFLQEIDRQLNSILDLEGRPGADHDNAWGTGLSTRAEVQDMAAEVRVKLDDLLGRAPAHDGENTQLGAIAHSLDDLARRVLALEAARP